MIASTDIRDPNEYVSGWLMEYCEQAGKTRFPWSYHVMCSLFTLGAIVGRKACLRRNEGTTYPPIGLMLLGESGVGKSCSFGIAVNVIKLATHDLPGYRVDTDYSDTIRGIMNIWEDTQARHQVNYLEGVLVMNELSAFLTNRVGTEIAGQWIIEMCENNAKVSTKTGGNGETAVENPRIGFGFASTLAYLRDACSGAHFAGGFMWRFLIAHEPRIMIDENRDGRVGEEACEQLAADAREIRDDAPDEMKLHPGAAAKLKSYRQNEESQYYPSSYLSGFWNRFEMNIAKVALLLALGDRRDEIVIDDIVRGHKLVRRKIYPPLVQLIKQIMAGPSKQRLFGVVDDLWFSGSKGWEIGALHERFDVTSIKRCQEIEVLLTSQNLLHMSANRKRVFATSSWRAEYDRENTNGPGEGGHPTRSTLAANWGK